MASASVLSTCLPAKSRFQVSSKSRIKFWKNHSANKTGVEVQFARVEHEMIVVRLLMPAEFRTRLPSGVSYDVGRPGRFVGRLSLCGISEIAARNRQV